MIFPTMISIAFSSLCPILKKNYANRWVLDLGHVSSLRSLAHSMTDSYLTKAYILFTRLIASCGSQRYTSLASSFQRIIYCCERAIEAHINRKKKLLKLNNNKKILTFFL